MESKKTARTPDRASLGLDGNGVALNTNCGIRTQDSSDTPKTSPLSIDTTFQEIKIPKDATEITIQNVDDEVFEVSRISNDSEGVFGTSFFYEGVTKTDSLWIRARSGSFDVDFYFGVSNPKED